MFDLRQVPNPKGNVELIETIGKGNFGFVYKGKLVATQAIAAVKVVQLKQEELREILLEVEIIRDCDHVNIVKLLGTFIRNEDLWICMEFCGAGAVDSVYRALMGPLSEDEIAVIIHQSIKGLHYLHKQNIIHRDIKSGNLLMTEEGELKLADFGVSALVTASTNFRAHSFIGTPYWMAPEVIMAENLPQQMYDCKADIWSIGITTIELADKNPPMSDIHPMRAMYLIPTADPKVLMVKNTKSWSKPFISFIQACLVKDAKLRPSAEEVLKQPLMAKITEWEASNKHSNVLKALTARVRVEKEQGRAKTVLGDKGSKARSQNQRADNEEDSSDEDDVYDEMVTTIVPTVSTQASNISNNNTPQPQPQSLAHPSAPPIVAERKKSVIAGIRGTTHPPSLTHPFISLGLFGRKSIDRARSIEVAEMDDAMSQDGPLDITAPFFYELQRLGVKSAGSPTTSNDSKSSNIGQQNSADSTPIVFSCVSLEICLSKEIVCSDVVSFMALPLFSPSPDPSSTKPLLPIFYSFLLAATDRELYAIDVTQHTCLSQTISPMYAYPDGGSRVRLLIKNTRFKQIHVLEDYDVCMVIAGERSRIRGYNLKSLKKMIQKIFGVIPLPTVSTAHDSSKAKGADDVDLLRSSLESNVKEMGYNQWANDYHKVLSTADSQHFIITRTKSTIFMGVQSRNDIVVFEWARQPYLKFMKVKQFWLPETPKFFEICHDGNRVHEILVVYEKEANFIEFESSKVTEINVHAEFKERQPSQIEKDRAQFRWKSFGQISPRDQAPSNNTANPPAPPMSWSATLKSMKPSTVVNASPSTTTSRSFFATFGATSIIVDINGTPVKSMPSTSPQNPMVTPVATSWSSALQPLEKNSVCDGIIISAPLRVLNQSLRYAVALHGTHIQVSESKTGELVQLIASHGSLRLMTPNLGSDFDYRRRGRIYLTSFNKKKKYSRIFWLHEVNYDVVGVETRRFSSDDALRASKAGTATAAKSHR